MEILWGLLDLPLWFILLPVAAFLLYLYGTKNYDFWTRQGIKGPNPMPFLGTFPKTLKAGCFANCDLGYVKEYGKIFGEFRNSTPTLCVADPEYLRLALIKDFSAMPNRGDMFTDTITDTMLISLTDDRWKHVRAAISPTFTSGKLKQMVGRVHDCTARFVEHLGENDGKPIDSKDALSSFTMDVISSTAFGIEMDSKSNPNHPMLWNAKEMMGLNVKEGIFGKFKVVIRVALFFLLCPKSMVKYLKWLGLDLFDMKAAEYFKSLLDKLIAGREPESKDKDFLQLCLNKIVPQPTDTSEATTHKDKYGILWSENGLSKDELVGNAMLFFAAGFETTASTLNYAMYELAWSPHVQEKLFMEIERVMEGRPLDEQPGYDEVDKMEYLEWVLNETMRLYPAAPRVERHINEETVIDGITLPKGGILNACIYAIHHDPEIWPEPFKFEPERYTKELKDSRHQHAWIPFGMGNRNCIAMRLAIMEMKIGLAAVVRNFKIETCEETMTKPFTFAKTMRIDPEETIILKVTNRHHKES